MTQETRQRVVPRRGMRLIMPFMIFAVVAVVLAVGLTLNPRDIPSPLVGKSVPEFTLPPVKGRALGLSSNDLKGEVSVLNIFASWCVPCRQEHPVLLAMQKERLAPIHGLNYKDRPDDAGPWLDKLGDPYTRTGADVDGRVGIDWGVYGVPETFVIDREGRIAYKHIGPITPQIVDEKIRPLILKLQATPSDPKTANARGEARN